MQGVFWGGVLAMAAMFAIFLVIGSLAGARFIVRLLSCCWPAARCRCGSPS